MSNADKDVLCLEFGKKEQLALRRALHDIKSPVSAIKLMVNSCPGLINISDSEVKDAINSSLGKLNHIAETLSHTLFKTHLWQNKKKNISEILSSLACEYKTLLQSNPSRKITFEFDGLDSAIDCQVAIPDNDLSRIISNLIENALESFDIAPNDPFSINVRAEITGGFLFVQIKDNGPGISEQILSSLFKKQISTKSDGKGTFLFDTKNFLRDIRGDIKISSIFGQGTDVSLWLPVLM